MVLREVPAGWTLLENLHRELQWGAVRTLSHHPHGRAFNLFAYMRIVELAGPRQLVYVKIARSRLTPRGSKEQVILQRLEIVSHLILYAGWEKLL